VLSQGRRRVGALGRGAASEWLAQQDLDEPVQEGQAFSAEGGTTSSAAGSFLMPQQQHCSDGSSPER
jgi:hypothetical protein